MHMPDGVLSLQVAIVCLSISIITILVAIWQTRKTLNAKRIPVIGVLAAALFAAQMYNFPIPYGSSGHLIGTALATTLVGPWNAILIIASILIIQAMFGDGGILAYGANVLNMAILGALSSWAILYFTPSKWKKSKLTFAIVAGVSGFISTIIMALGASTEMAISGSYPAHLIYGWMVGLHAIIGLAEGLITFVIVHFTFRADPAMFEQTQQALYITGITDVQDETFRIPKWTFFVTLGAFAFMSLFGLIASENPDGLERTFEVLGITPTEGGIISFGEGLGFEILQMFLAMLVLFAFLVGVSYLYYRFKRHRAQKTTAVEQVEIAQ